jgi:hypothetical protein
MSHFRIQRLQALSVNPPFPKRDDHSSRGQLSDPASLRAKRIRVYLSKSCATSIPFSGPPHGDTRQWPAVRDRGPGGDIRWPFHAGRQFQFFKTTLSHEFCYRMIKKRLKGRVGANQPQNSYNALNYHNSAMELLCCTRLLIKPDSGQLSKSAVVSQSE